MFESSLIIILSAF